MTHTLQINNITKLIKKTQILYGISMDIKSGEIVGIIRAKWCW